MCLLIFSWTRLANRPNKQFHNCWWKFCHLAWGHETVTVWDIGLYVPRPYFFLKSCLKQRYLWYWSVWEVVEGLVQMQRMAYLYIWELFHFINIHCLLREWIIHVFYSLAEYSRISHLCSYTELCLVKSILFLEFDFYSHRVVEV